MGSDERQNLDVRGGNMHEAIGYAVRIGFWAEVGVRVGLQASVSEWSDM